MKIRPVDTELFHADRRTDEHTTDMTNLIVIFAILRMRLKMVSFDAVFFQFYSKNTYNMLVSRGMCADKVQRFLTPSSNCTYNERRYRFQSMLQTQRVTFYIFAVININIAVFLD
jgi:hypothetical protein